MFKKAPKKDDICEIRWNAQSEAEWDARFAAVKRSNLLQSSAYGRGVARLNNQRVRRGVIYVRGEEAGLVQILEAGILNNAIHGVILDRGPLWFDGFENAENVKAFLAAFNADFPRRFGRKIRFIPELEDRPVMRQAMEGAGFRPVSAQGYQTYWLDLRQSDDDLRNNMSANWRRELRKAEEENLETVISFEGAHFAWLMQNHVKDRREKGYDGASLKTLVKLSAEFSRGQNMIIATALFDGAPIASILIFIHGSSATYQVGYSSPKGRETRAHYALLWQVVEALKERDITDFDLGGVNDETAKGVKKFKQGMGGALVKTLGMYR